MFDRLSASRLAAASAFFMIASPALAGQEPVVVYAEPEEAVRTERVSFADLDLATKSGERGLHRRVAAAVRTVCADDFTGSALPSTEFYRCSDGAWAKARPQMAQAVTRAQQLALNGKSSLAAAAITISVR